jgi:hypothetical protein
MGRFMMNRNQNLKFGSFVMNAILVLGAFFLALNLVAPLFGSKFSVYAIVVYGDWIATSLLGKLFLSRVQKGLPIRAFEYLLACLVGIIGLLGLFPNLIGIILSILYIVGGVFVYRAQRKKNKEEAQGSPIKRHLSREKSIPTVRGVSSSPSGVPIGVGDTNQ